MRFLEILRFELAHQARRPSNWLFFLLLLGITTHMAREIFIGSARRDGYFFNAPFVIAAVTLLGGIMGLLAPAALAGDAGGRDVRTRLHPLLYTLPLGKAEYLGGRFLGAFIVTALVFLALPAGHALATVLPGAERELIGPFRPLGYIGAYALLALPNALVATALPFSLAVLSRRTAASYLASIALFFLAMVSWQLVGTTMGHWQLAKLLDPLGLAAMSELSRTWTSVEKSTRLLAPEGSLLLNRMLWVGVALASLALTTIRFRFAHESTRGRWIGARNRRATLDPLPQSPAVAPFVARMVAPIAMQPVARAFGPATRARQVLAIATESFRIVVVGWGGLALAVLTILLVLSGPVTMQHLGVPLLPATGHLTAYIGDFGEPLWAVIPLLIVYYAGELVWRERDGRLAEIADAAPVPEWAPFTGRFLGLAAVLVLLQALVMAATMVVQASAGYYSFELGLYVQILFGLQLADYLLFALLALAVQVVVNQKYVGHLLALLAFVVMAFGSEVGIGHGLLVYGSDPGWSYSDMRGFAPFIGPWLLFKLYWAGWAALIALVAAMLWVRGTEQHPVARLNTARRRFSGRPVRSAAALAGGLVLVLGAVVWYETQAAGDRVSPADALSRRAEYERRYGAYARAPQPRLARVSLRVDLHPRRRALDVHGTYVLVNASGRAIDTVHVAPSGSVTTRDATFDRPATLAIDDDEVGHRIYVLGTPLQPGDTLRLEFDVSHAVRGIPSGAAHLAIVPNGSYVRSDWMPAIGYQTGREITSPGERRLHGLAPRPALPPLDDVRARDDVAAADAEMIAFDAIVGTDSAQLAVAPGALRRSWTEGERRYFHYVADAPIRNDYAFFSARYVVNAGEWNDVRTEIVHHPGHTHNLARMQHAMQASLEYLGDRFGSYPHRQIRLVEHPGRATSLRAYPVNISYNEGFSLFDPDHDSRNIDFPFAVVAHEVAHQWWGNRLTPALAEGSALLTESLAWYSAFGVVEATHGRAHLERILAMMRITFLSPRARAGLPLLRAHDWLHAYRKGPFAFHAVREYVGQDALDLALRRLLERHQAGTPPLPTALDLYRELQAVTPYALHSLLADLFEANTYWELAAEQAGAVRLGDGSWRAWVDVRARKVVVDSVGVEREVPMDDLIEVGFLAADGAAESGEPRDRAMHRIRSGVQRVAVTVPFRPARAVVDPRALLIDVEPQDNAVTVRTE